MDDFNDFTADKFTAVLGLIDSVFTDREKAQFMQILCYKAVDELGIVATRRYIEEQELAIRHRSERLRTLPIVDTENETEH